MLSLSLNDQLHEIIDVSCISVNMWRGITDELTANPQARAYIGFFFGGGGHLQISQKKSIRKMKLKNIFFLECMLNVKQSDRNSLKTDTFHKPTNYEPHV